MATNRKIRNRSYPAQICKKPNIFKIKLYPANGHQLLRRIAKRMDYLIKRFKDSRQISDGSVLKQPKQASDALTDFQQLEALKDLVASLKDKRRCHRGL